MNAPETISVLMCVRDERAVFLRQSIASIVAQTWSDWSFVIVDDGSSRQETLECLHEAQAAEPRIRLFRIDPIGLTRALNHGLGLCRGRYVFRQDSDDWSEPERFRAQFAAMEASPRALACGTGVFLHQENGTALWNYSFPEAHGEILRAFPRMNPFHHGSLAFRAEAILRAGGYRPELPVAQDYDLTWRLSEQGETLNLREPFYHYRRTSRAVSTTRGAEMDRVVLAVRALAKQRQGGQREDVVLALKEAEVHLARSGSSDARDGLRRGDHLLLSGFFRQALGAYARALMAGAPLPLTLLKVGRLAAFALVPPLRRWLFLRGG